MADTPLLPPPAPTPPTLNFWQYILYLIITVVLGACVSYFTTSLAAKQKVNDVVVGYDTKKQIDDLVKAAAASSVPIVGEIRSFAFGGQRGDSSIEELRKLGWLECAGQSIGLTPNTKELYEKLNRAQTWGKIGDRIRIPDLRGTFLRGWSHGAATKNEDDIDSRIVPSGRSDLNSDKNSVGTKQLSAFHEHTHKQQSSLNPGGSPSAEGLSGWNANGMRPVAITTLGADPAGASETRPKNVYVLFCIYVGHPIGPDDIDYGDTPNGN
jgi:hypothetical protein